MRLPAVGALANAFINLAEFSANRTAFRWWFLNFTPENKRLVMSKKKVFSFVLFIVSVAASFAATGDTSAIVTSVTGATASASDAYIAAAGLGVAALVVSVIVYMSRKGWKLR